MEHVSFFSTLKQFWHCSKSIFCMLNSVTVALHNNTQGSSNEAFELHLYVDKSFAPADDIRQASLVRLPCIYDTTPPRALINRCDLTERITHEPSLICSLFPSGPGDRSSSHIPLTLESLKSSFPNPTAQGCVRSVGCFCSISEPQPSFIPLES